MPNERIVAYYDLKHAPITFDFCHFLAAAAANAQSQGQKTFDLVILADRFRNATVRESNYTHVERHWRLWNLHVELAKIVPQIENLTVARTLPQSIAKLTYPPHYHPIKNPEVPYDVRTVTQMHKAGMDVQIFRPSEAAVLAADRLLAKIGPKYVTITLRKAAYDASRNSRLSEWYEFSRVLNSRGFATVIIPDQDDALSDRTINQFDWTVIDVAAMSVDLRLALYTKAATNYVTNNGMVGLFMYSKVPFIWFSVLVDGSQVASRAYYERQGLSFGGKYSWLADNQRMIWEPDTLAHLVASLPLET